VGSTTVGLVRVSKFWSTGLAVFSTVGVSHVACMLRLAVSSSPTGRVLYCLYFDDGRRRLASSIMQVNSPQR